MRKSYWVTVWYSLVVTCVTSKNMGRHLKCIICIKYPNIREWVEVDKKYMGGSFWFPSALWKVVVSENGPKYKKYSLVYCIFSKLNIYLHHGDFSYRYKFCLISCLYSKRIRRYVPEIRTLNHTISNALYRYLKIYTSSFAIRFERIKKNNTWYITYYDICNAISISN